MDLVYLESAQFFPLTFLFASSEEALLTDSDPTTPQYLADNSPSKTSILRNELAIKKLAKNIAF